MSKHRLEKRDSGTQEDTGSNPTDRGKCGCKRHILSDAKGIPVAVVLSGANRHDMKKLESLLNAVIIARPSEADHEATPPVSDHARKVRFMVKKYRPR